MAGYAGFRLIPTYDMRNATYTSDFVHYSDREIRDKDFQRLLVDYEWMPSGFDPDDVAAGLRGKQWFGDHIAVGATYVDENRAGEEPIGDFRLGRDLSAIPDAASHDVFLVKVSYWLPM